MAKNYIEKQNPNGGKNTIVITGQVDNDSQAKTKAECSMKEKNSEKITGSFSVSGNPLLVAGVNIDLTGIGAFSGKWHIVSSTHTIDIENGYVTDVEVRKIFE